MFLGQVVDITRLVGGSHELEIRCRPLDPAPRRVAQAARTLADGTRRRREPALVPDIAPRACARASRPGRRSSVRGAPSRSSAGGASWSRTCAFARRLDGDVGRLDDRRTPPLARRRVPDRVPVELDGPSGRHEVDRGRDGGGWVAAVRGRDAHPGRGDLVAAHARHPCAALRGSPGRVGRVDADARRRTGRLPVAGRRSEPGSRCRAGRTRPARQRRPRLRPRRGLDADRPGRDRRSRGRASGIPRAGRGRRDEHAARPGHRPVRVRRVPRAVRRARASSCGRT